jgi:hypothetical protein
MRGNKNSRQNKKKAPPLPNFFCCPPLPKKILGKTKRRLLLFLFRHQKASSYKGTCIAVYRVYSSI